MAEVQVVEISVIPWLLKSGGLLPLVLGLVLAVVGVIFVIRPNRTASWILACLSLLPALIGLVVVYMAAVDYSRMASSPLTPKPAEFAELTWRAMGASFFALVGTLVPMTVALVAISRSRTR